MLSPSKRAQETRKTVWAAAETYHQNSCQSRFWGVYLVFEVLQERDFKEMLQNFISRFVGVYLAFEVFQTRVAHICFLPCSHKNAVSHIYCRILCSVALVSFDKEKLLMGAWFLFSRKEVGVSTRLCVHVYLNRVEHVLWVNWHMLHVVTHAFQNKSGTLAPLRPPTQVTLPSASKWSPRVTALQYPTRSGLPPSPETTLKKP